MSDYICNIRCSYRQPSGYCGRTGGYETCQYRQLHVDAKPFGNGIDVCPVCGKPSTIGKPQTNADRIRAMTDEELATVIAWPYLASPPWCSEHTTCPYISEDPTPCDKCALEWLKQEVSE